MSAVSVSFPAPDSPREPDAGSPRWPSLAPDFAALVDQFGPLCATAVDPLEIAALLESSGLNDARARAMGRADVFAVADELWATTDREPPLTSGPRRFRVELSRHAIRGTLYLLPAVVAAALFSRETDIGGAPLLLGALVLGWGASQAVAYCAYVCLGRGRNAAAARLLLVALATTLATSVVVASVWTAASLPAVTAAWIAAAELTYFLAATTLFVLGRDRLLLLLMSPLGVLCVVAVVARDVPGELLAAVAGSTVVGVSALAAVVAARASGGGRLRGALARDDVFASFPDGAAAVALALWLVWSALNRVHAGGAGSAFLAASTVPVVIAAALAEWRIARYREGIDDLLRTVDAADRFRRLSAGLLRTTLVAFAATLAVVALVVFVVQALVAGLGDVTLTEHAGMAVLGFVFFLSSLLASFGSATVVARFAVTVGVPAVVAQLIARPDHPELVWVAFLGAGLALATTLVTAASRRLTQPRPHR